VSTTDLTAYEFWALCLHRPALPREHRRWARAAERPLLIGRADEVIE
jgi:hypothetical protein